MLTKYYSLKRILATDSVYNMVISARSNGKTYSVLKYALEKYVKNGEQLGILRRWREDYIGKRGAVLFDALVDNHEVSKLTKGKFTSIHYSASKWYLCKYVENERILDEKPFAYGFALSSMEHDKSTSYPKITTIMFDEFLSRNGYLSDEFVLFMNAVSTIVRDRTNVKIFMLGNTITKFCPYFDEMGLKHISKMKIGDLDIYTYGDSGLKVAVEYAEQRKSAKNNNYYFAFDNPRLDMITNGAWELKIYPHCPVKYRPKDVLYTFFIKFDAFTFQCDIISTDSENFIFIYPKTTEIKDENALIYSTEYSALPNVKRKITSPASNIERKIANYFKQDKVFYSSNEVGDVIENYLIWCSGD